MHRVYLKGKQNLEQEGFSTWAVTLTKPTNSPMEPFSSSALSSNMLFHRQQKQKFVQYS
jgi:hypothetical protein